VLLLAEFDDRALNSADNDFERRQDLKVVPHGIHDESQSSGVSLLSRTLVVSEDVPDPVRDHTA
jgi:hypothetical protein